MAFRKTLLPHTLLSLAIASFAPAQSLSITGIISETVGTTAEITGSGNASNTNDWAIGSVGRFEINNGDYYMQVNATNPTGAIQSGGIPLADSLMVARTVNSQGLTDDGTLSLYVRPPSNGNWSLAVNFSFFSDSGFTTPAPITDFTLTSLDIDYSQRYYTSSSTFDTNITYADTQISSIPSTDPSWISAYNGFTSPGDATFDDARFAVTSRGDGSSFDIVVAHSSVALFMFEFRNPPQIVPEPSAALLGGIGCLCGMAIRRRNKG